MDRTTLEIYYKNAAELIKYRGGTITTDLLTSDKIVQQYREEGYIYIHGHVEKSHDYIEIYMFTEGSPYIKHVAEFKKVMAQVSEKCTSLLIFAHDPASTYIAEHLKVIQEEGAAHNLYVIYAPLYRIAINLPQHVTVPTIEIATQQEIDEYLNFRMINIKMLPKIKHTDALAVWAGLRPGAICKITKKSVTAGLAMSYRLCV